MRDISSYGRRLIVKRPGRLNGQQEAEEEAEAEGEGEEGQDIVEKMAPRTSWREGTEKENLMGPDFRFDLPVAHHLSAVMVNFLEMKIMMIAPMIVIMAYIQKRAMTT